MNLKYIFFILLIGATVTVIAQPQYSTSPASFTAVDEFTLTVNVTGTSLEGHSGDVWIWSWISKGCSSNCDAPTNLDPAGPDASNALMTRDDVNPNVYRITMVAADFFEKPPSELQQIGFKLKSASWGDGKQSDNDAFLDIDPLEFTASVNRSFPSKPRADDVITLYFDQDLETNLDVKYHVGKFKILVTAYDAEGNQVGEVLNKATKAESETSHVISFHPEFEFGANLYRITYTYTAQDFRDTAQAMFEGRMGPLDWTEKRPLSDGAVAFSDIRKGRTTAPKTILAPEATA